MLRKVYFEADPLALGFSLGVTLAIGIFFLGFLASAGYCTELVEFISKIFINYEANFKGSIIGALWAFLSAFFFGYVAAKIYNMVSQV
jgi:hypothetical protein